MEYKENKINEEKDEQKHDNPVSQPDPETLHKTDPQDEMKGPISSALNKVREKAEDKGSEDISTENKDDNE